MKKRLVAVLMTAAMVCSMGSVSAVSVFAEEETAEAAGDEDVVYVDPLEAEDGLPFAATELSKGKTIGVSVQTHANAFSSQRSTVLKLHWKKAVLMQK